MTRGSRSLIAETISGVPSVEPSSMTMHSSEARGSAITESMAHSIVDAAFQDGTRTDSRGVSPWAVTAASAIDPS